VRRGHAAVSISLAALLDAYAQNKYNMGWFDRCVCAKQIQHGFAWNEYAAQTLKPMQLFSIHL
jgi:hypothetical protein